MASAVLFIVRVRYDMSSQNTLPTYDRTDLVFSRLGMIELFLPCPHKEMGGGRSAPQKALFDWALETSCK